MQVHDFLSRAGSSHASDFSMSLAMKPYHDIPQGFSPLSSSSISMSGSSGRSASVGPSSKASRSPPMRQRTPIRHNRQSMSRTRPDALLAYATQNEPPISYPNSFMSSSGSYPVFGSQPPSYSFSSAESFLPRSSSYSFDSTPAPADSFPYSMPTTSWSQPVLPPPAGYVPRQQPIEGVRVVNPRPKPQCWQHQCGGREFSTFSNLLRHQREKSGNSLKHACPRCSTVFTRTTAMKGHLSGGKCKGKRQAPSD